MSTTPHCVCLCWEIDHSAESRTSLGPVKWETLHQAVAALYKDSLPADQRLTGSSDPQAQIQIAPDPGVGDRAIFVSAREAVESALRFQWKVSHHDWAGAPAPVQIRISIVAGETMPPETDDQNQDQGVLIPTRKVLDLARHVLSLAAPGRILVTSWVSAEAREDLGPLPEEIPLNEEGVRPLLHFANHGFFDYPGRQRSDDLLNLCEAGIQGLAPLEPLPSSPHGWPCDANGSRIGLQKPEWQPVLGTLVPGADAAGGGRWELVRRLGMGGFGETWLAHERETKDRRVFKFPHDPLHAGALFRDTALAASLRHQMSQLEDARHADAIGMVLAISEEPPYWIATEYCPEGSLVDWSAAHPGGIAALPPEQRIQFMVELCRAVDAAHEVQVVHGDIRPGNVFVHSDGWDGTIHPILTGFGMGCLVHPELRDEWVGGQAGMGMYAPPEHRTAGTHASAKGDVYALGVVLYQMMIGDFTQPWESAQDCARRIKDELLCRIIIQSLDSEPHRFGTAQEMAARLESLEADRAASGEARLRATLAETQTKLEAERRRSRRRKATAAVMAVLASCAAGGWIHGMRQAGRSASEGQRARSSEGGMVAAQKSTEVALHKAEQQTRDVEAGFASVFKSLETLFEEHYLRGIGSTPGLHVREARILQNSLRDQLRAGLKRLHEEQPAHRGCLISLYRIEMEEVRAAHASGAWKDAKQSIKDAGQWMKLLGPLSAAEVDLCADFYFWEPVCHHYFEEDKERSQVLNKDSLARLRELRARHPNSQRLHAAEIRLRSSEVFNDEDPEPQYYWDLFQEICQIPAHSSGQMPEADLDLVMSKLLLFFNAFPTDGGRRAMQPAHAEAYLGLLEKEVLGNPAIFPLGMEIICQRHDQLVRVLAPRLSSANPQGEATQKRSQFGRLRDVIKVMMKRSHGGPDVVARHEELLELERRLVAPLPALARTKEASPRPPPPRPPPTMEERVAQFIRDHHQRISQRDLEGYAADMADVVSRNLNGRSSILTREAVRKSETEYLAARPALVETVDEKTGGEIDTQPMPNGLVSASYVLLHQHAAHDEALGDYRLAGRMRVTKVLRQENGRWLITDDESLPYVPKKKAGITDIPVVDHHVPGHPTWVQSPHGEQGMFVNVAGMRRGSLVSCPYSGKIFRLESN